MYRGAHENDAKWYLVADDFDDAARFSEWDIPTVIGHPLLPALLAQLPPSSWFDAPLLWSDSQDPEVSA